MAANMAAGDIEIPVSSLKVVLGTQNWCLDLGFQGQGIHILHSYKPLLHRNRKIQDGHQYAC